MFIIQSYQYKQIKNNNIKIATNRKMLDINSYKNVIKIKNKNIRVKITISINTK